VPELPQLTLGLETVTDSAGVFERRDRSFQLGDSAVALACLT
jgi:hypothetical protein